jgi:hypothetical protein
MTRLVPLKEMENIQVFLKGTPPPSFAFAHFDKILVAKSNLNLTYLTNAGMWTLGIPSNNLFMTSDLYKRKNMGQVMASIYALNLRAPALGWTGPIIEDKFSKSQGKPKNQAKKWAQVDTKVNKVQVDEFMAKQKTPEAEIHALKLQVAELKADMRTYKADNGNLKGEIAHYKQQLGQSTSAAKMDEVGRTKAELVKEKQVSFLIFACCSCS